MKISDFFSAGKVNNANLKSFAKPFVALILVVILGILFINIGISRVRTKMAEHKAALEVESQLASKLSGLEGSGIGSLENANKLVIALPDKNSVMIMISQVKRLALEKGITVGKLEISGMSGDPALSSIQLITEIQGQDLEVLMEFLNEIPHQAPVSSIYGVRLINRGEGLYGGNVELTVFWSGFPQTIPSVSDPAVSLTEPEEAILKAISELREPEFTDLKPNPLFDRPEPFN